MWQDLVFTAGSVFSILVLVPTLRDHMATVPVSTSLPSALIGVVYGTAFFTMGMVFSAVGSLATGLLWSLIAAYRSPDVAAVDRPPGSPRNDGGGSSSPPSGEEHGA